jgi:hypothetical protein
VVRPLLLGLHAHFRAVRLVRVSALMSPPGPTKARLPESISLRSPQCKVLTPNNFTDLDQIRDRLAAFETRYNEIARPFTWKFTRTDLGDLLRRIDAHDKTQPHALAA